MYTKSDKYKTKYLNLKYGGRSDVYPIKITYDSAYNRGVIATRKILVGNIIEICPGIIDDDENFIGVIRDYIFKLSDNEDKSVVAFGNGSLYNHSDDNNAEYYMDDDKLYFKAIKDIDIGDEIFVHYGDNYWSSRNYLEKK